MPEYTENTEFFWRITVDARPLAYSGEKYYEVTLYPATKQSDFYGWIEQYPRDTKPGHFYSGLELRAASYTSAEGPPRLVNWQAHYVMEGMRYKHSHLDVDMATQIAKTLKRMETGYEKLRAKFGPPANFGQYVAYFSEAIGKDCLGWLKPDHTDPKTLWEYPLSDLPYYIQHEWDRWVRDNFPKETPEAA